MTRRTITIFLLNGLLLLLAMPLFAGGWAVVTVDDLPHHLRTGEVTTLGFTVRQHGQHGVNLENVSVQVTEPTSGETLAFTARQVGATGHYVVDIVLPKAGLWNWEIHPDWFPPMAMMPISVIDDRSVNNAMALNAAGVGSLLPWLLTGVGAVLLSSAALNPRFAARRYRMMTGGLGLLIVVGGLGWAALGTRLPRTVAAQPTGTAGYGRALFMAKGCNSCHLHDQALNQWSTEVGPNLTHYQNTAEYLHGWLKDPQAIKPNTEMPNLALKLDEIEALTAFLIPAKK